MPSPRNPPPAALSHAFESPFVRLRHPASLAAVVQRYPPEAGGRRHTLVVGEPAADGAALPNWAGGDRRGFRLTVVPLPPGSARGTTIADAIAAGMLHPAGGAEGLIARPFGGQPALWRLPAHEGVDACWAYAVAFSYLWMAQWQRPLSDPAQAALLASVEFLDPAA